MFRRNQSKMEKLMIDQTAGLNVLTVEYWRERFRKVRPRFENLTELHELLSPKDPVFAGTKGYLRLRNIQNDTGGLNITALAAVLMEELRPGEEAETDGRPSDDPCQDIIARHGLQQAG